MIVNSNFILNSKKIPIVKKNWSLNDLTYHRPIFYQFGPPMHILYYMIQSNMTNSSQVIPPLWMSMIWVLSSNPTDPNSSNQNQQNPVQFQYNRTIRQLGAIRAIGLFVDKLIQPGKNYYFKNKKSTSMSDKQNCIIKHIFHLFTVKFQAKDVDLIIVQAAKRVTDRISIKLKIPTNLIYVGGRSAC